MCKMVVKLFLVMILFDKTVTQNVTEEPENFDEVANEINLHIFLTASIILFALIHHYLQIYEIPISYSIFAMLIGILWGIGTVYFQRMRDIFTMTHNNFLQLSIIYGNLIIFSTAFCIDIQAFLKSITQILIISLPVAMLSSIMCGFLMRQVLDTDWRFEIAIFFGCLFMPIYPIDILHILKENTNIKQLAILLEGETVVAAVVAYYCMEALAIHNTGSNTEWYSIVLRLLKMASMGIPLSLLIGWFSNWFMRLAYNDLVVIMLLTFTICFGSYYLVHMIALTGTFACLVAGMMTGMQRASLPTEIDNNLKYFWKLLCFFMNSIFYMSCGVMIPWYLKDYFGIIDYVMVLVTYVVCNVCRFVSFLCFYPILKRTGYGLTIKNLVINVWGGAKSPIVLGSLLKFVYYFNDARLERVYFLHVFCVHFLYLLINTSTFPVLLSIMGLSQRSVIKMVNMNSCIKYIFQARDRNITILKMDRFLSDANWPLVTNTTNMKHPYKRTVTEGQEDEEDVNFSGYNYTLCPDCKQNVPNELTPKELRDMRREARIRILKLEKIYYSRQYENGMVSKDGKRILTQAVEMAMDTEECVIDLDNFYVLFKKEGYFFRYLRNCLQFLQINTTNTKIPRKHWRKICYKIIEHPAFIIFIYLVICCVVATNIYIFVVTPNIPDASAYILMNFNIAFSLLSVIEFLLKIFGYSWIYVYRHGVKTYFRSCWNIIAFFVMITAFFCVIHNAMAIFIHSYAHSQFFVIITYILGSIEMLRIIEFVKLFTLCRVTYEKAIKYLETKIDRHRAIACELAKNFISGEEEILENLSQIVENEKIREELRAKIEQDRLALIKVLGLAQKDRPLVAVTVKTKQAIRTVLSSMKDDINDLKMAGWVDDVEYVKLCRSLSERYKFVNSLKSIPPPSARLIFKDILWTGEDLIIKNFLYENLIARKFQPGDIVYNEGDIAQAIYIVISGVLMISYSKNKTVMDKIVGSGALPIIDYMSSNRNTDIIDYVIAGNCIGELGILTGRPYNCVVTAETGSQVYILSKEILQQAMEMDSDPINGLECRIWKSVSYRIALRILMNSTTYGTYTPEKIKYVLERSFMPKIAHYKMFIVTEMMEDIILIEGVVVDYNTREVYTGPCYIPRSVQKILFSSSSINVEMRVEIKLMIIPGKDLNGYEIMLDEQMICEMVNDDMFKCLQRILQDRSAKSFLYRTRRIVLKKSSKQSEISGNKSKLTFASSISPSQSYNKAK